MRWESGQSCGLHEPRCAVDRKADLIPPHLTPPHIPGTRCCRGIRRNILGAMKEAKQILCATACLLAAVAAYGDDVVLPSRDAVFTALPAAGYTEKPDQIPATYIDAGILQNVPYVSYRVGENRELNVYGDLTAPACIEIGLYSPALDSQDERRRCLALIHKLVPKIDLYGISIVRGKSMRSGVVIEITPATDPDAYGAWWVSVYSLPLINAATGSSANISTVTVTATEAERTGVWTQEEQHKSRRGSRTPGKERMYYVRDYTRANGTHVHSYRRN
jgi:hypothetical protein